MLEAELVAILVAPPSCVVLDVVVLFCICRVELANARRASNASDVDAVILFSPALNSLRVGAARSLSEPTVSEAEAPPVSLNEKAPRKNKTTMSGTNTAVVATSTIVRCSRGDLC